MWRRSLLLPASAVLLTVLACSPTVGPRDDAAARLERVLPELTAAAEVTGLAVAVVRPGQPTWTGAYGVRNAETGEPVMTDTVFEAASLSKPVVAYAVLRMAERGEIDLDAPLAGYLAYERLEHDPRYQKITARHVLSHSSGLPNWGGTPLEMLFEPGERFGYSGEGFVYLQKVIEQLTGEPLDAIASREVFAPLGMHDSSFVWRDAFATRIADGHDAWGKPLAKTRRAGGDANAAGSLLTTAGDYAKLLAAVLDGKGLDAATRRDMLAPAVQVRERRSGDLVDRVYWGLGWGLQRGTAGDAFFHWGDNPGYKAYTIGYPESGAALVFFTNCDDGLSIVEPVAAAFADDSHEALAWIGYDRYDAPERIVRRALVRAFREGVEAGAARYRELQAEHAGLDFEPPVNRAGYDLLHEQAFDAAVAAFELNVAAHPESANAYDSLAEAYMTAGRAAAAITHYERSLELDADNDNARARVAWIRESLAAREDPARLPAAVLEGFAGGYGPIAVALEGDTLQATIEGRQGSFTLVPLAGDTFDVEGLGGWRLRFVADDEGKVAKVVAFNVDGEQRELPRDP